jgi:hypothetical protein
MVYILKKICPQCQHVGPAKTLGYPINYFVLLLVRLVFNFLISLVFHYIFLDWYRAVKINELMSKVRMTKLGYADLVIKLQSLARPGHALGRYTLRIFYNVKQNEK